MKQASSKRAWIAGLVFALMGAVAGGALAGISTTRHNLSSGSLIATATDGSSTTIRSTDQDEICVFCHTPHQAIKNNNIPLWNHNLSSQASYGVYTSLTYNAGATTVDLGTTNSTAAAEISNLCLSCHDGTVAINSLNNASNRFSNALPTMQGVTAGTGVIPTALKSNLGTDLKNDHPVNFTYNAALVTADGGGLNDPTALTEVKLYSEKVQCASCHDPHTSTQPVFLRSTMAGSAMCLKCHNK